MSEEVKELITEQDNICAMILKAQVNLKKSPKARLTKGYIQTRKESLENYWSQFTANNRRLNKVATAADKVSFDYFKEDMYSTCEDTFIDFKADMIDMLEGSTPCTSNMSIYPTPSTSDDVKLPKIDIAKFTGNYQDWTSFYDMFTSLIHNKQNLSSVQKMHYLKSYLSGEPAQLLNHLAVTDSNYQLAWLTLQNRYNNKRVIVNSILNKLMNQKNIQTGTATAIREILDTTMECLNKLEIQSINTSSWDTIIIHTIVDKLDTETHKEWEEEASSLSLTELPTMSMFKKFLEKRFRVLEMMQPNQTMNMNMKNTNRSIQRETNFTVEPKSFHVSPVIKCGFCKQSHPLNQCKEFQELTLEKKTDFIQNQQLCFNCLIPGHAVRFCRSKFSCQKCGRRHHTQEYKQDTTKKRESSSRDTNQEIDYSRELRLVSTLEKPKIREEFEHNSSQEREELQEIFRHENKELAKLNQNTEYESKEINQERETEKHNTEELYEKTTTRDEDGRYIVELPIRHKTAVLPSNSREIALSRWKSTENRIKSKPELKKKWLQYKSQMSAIRDVSLDCSMHTLFISSLEKLMLAVSYSYCKRWLRLLIVIDRGKQDLHSYLKYEQRNDALKIGLRM